MEALPAAPSPLVSLNAFNIQLFLFQFLQVIGALYKDGGLAAAQQFVLRHWKEDFERHIDPPLFQSTSRLRRWCMKRGMRSPKFVVVSCTSEPLELIATISIRGVAATGTGRHADVKTARKLASADLLRKLAAKGEEV